MVGVIKTVICEGRCTALICDEENITRNCVILKFHRRFKNKIKTPEQINKCFFHTVSIISFQSYQVINCIHLLAFASCGVGLGRMGGGWEGVEGCKDTLGMYTMTDVPKAQFRGVLTC